MKRAALLFFVVAMIYVAPGFLPGRTFAPLDLPFDFGAWKSDPTQRVRVANTLLSDVVVQFIPWDREIRRLFAAGENPWVNRFAGDGGPLYANLQTALFSPFTWPRLIFGLEGWAVMALLKLLCAALCAYWFARELDLLPRHAIVSALVYATAAYTIVWLLYPITNVFAVVPGLAAAALRLMKEPAVRNAMLVILFAALCTAGGHPETLFVGVAGIWVFLAWESEKRPGFGIGALVPSTVGAFLGFLLLFVQLGPFFSLVGDSYASEIRPQMEHGFRGWAVVSQILPGILGSPLRGELDLAAVVSAEDFNHRVGGYVGALVLLAVILAWRSLTPVLQRGLIVGAAALFISWYPLGVWPILRYAPLVRVVALEYGVVLFVLFTAMAAGPALAHVASRPRRKIGTALLLAGIVTLLAGLLPALPAARPALTRAARTGISALRERGHLQQPNEVYEQRLAYYLSAAGTTTLKRVALPAALWILAAVSLLAPVKRRDLVLSVAAIGELVAFGAGFNPAVPMTGFAPEPETIALVKRLDPARQFLVAANFEVFPANAGTVYGVRDVVSYDVLTSRSRVKQLIAAGYNPPLHSINPMLSQAQTQALAALGVRYVLSRTDVPSARRIGPPAPAVGVYELPSAIPPPIPQNDMPPRMLVGAIVSLLALAGSAAWLRLYTLAPPATEALSHL